MPDQIDFLKADNQASLQKLKQKKILKLGSLIFLIFYCLLAAAIFSFSLYLSQANRGLNKAIALKKKQIVQLQKTESLQLLLKQRLVSLAPIFSQKRPDYHRDLLFFKEISPQGLNLTDFKFSEKQKMSVKGEATNALILNDFLRQLKVSTVATQEFAKVNLGSLSRKTDGSYEFSLNLELKQ